MAYPDAWNTGSAIKSQAQPSASDPLALNTDLMGGLSNDPRVQQARRDRRQEMIDKYRKTSPETTGSLAQGSMAYPTQASSLNPMQTNVERMSQMRQNYYLGGTPDYAKNAAATAAATGAEAGNKLALLGSDAAHRSDQVFNRSYGAPGPSGAQALLNQGTNEAIGTQLALARSGRGMGQSASAMQTAQNNAVGLQTSAANNAAILKAQEAEAYAQRRDAAQRANDQAAVAFGQLGQSGFQTGGQTSLAGQALGQQVQMGALSGNQGYEGELANLYGMSKGYGLQEQQRQDQQNAAYAQMAGTALSAYAASGSDRRMKTDVYKLSPIEAKKDRQLGSAGDFDALPAEDFGSYDSMTTSPSAGSFPAIQARRPLVARSSGLLHGYQTPSEFATALGPGDASRLGKPNERLIVNPWAPGVQAQQQTDPWAEYLAKRTAREEAAAKTAEEDKNRSRLSGLIGLLATGGLMLGMRRSDERTKTKKRPLGRLAQDPMPSMPAISGRGMIRSDAKSKAQIKDLAAENERLQAENAWMGPRLTPEARKAAPASTTLVAEARALKEMDQHLADKAVTASKAVGKAAPNYIPLAPDWEAFKAGRTRAVSGEPASPETRGMSIEDALRQADEASQYAALPNPAVEQGALDYADALQRSRDQTQPDIYGRIAPPATPPSLEYRARQRENLPPLGGANELTGAPAPALDYEQQRAVDWRVLHPGPDSEAPNHGDRAAGHYLPNWTDEGTYNLSDKRQKQSLFEGDAAQQAMRAAPGYSYKYKDPGAPGAAPGTHFGPMAQDLEKTPAGKSTVVQGPDGMKMVDTGRLALVNTAALHAQQEELDRLKAELAAMRGRRAA